MKKIMLILLFVCFNSFLFAQNYKVVNNQIIEIKKQSVTKKSDSIYKVYNGITFYKGSKGGIYFYKKSKKTNQLYKCYVKQS